MKKYFKEELQEEKKLSEYLQQELQQPDEEEKNRFRIREHLDNNQKEYKGSIYNKSTRVARTEYIMEILGDISLDKDTYQLFISQFQKYSGQYDNLTKPETFKGIYEIIQKHPYLKPEAIKKIWMQYIKDLFDEHLLTDILEIYIEKLGKTDETIESYLYLVKKTGQEHQKKYDEESLMLNELRGQYSSKYIGHLKRLVTKQHYHYDDIISILPEPDLVQKDEQHIQELSKRTRIIINCCSPLSYKMIDLMLEDEELSKCIEQPVYNINFNTNENATFSKEEYIESVKRQKSKKLKK